MFDKNELTFSKMKERIIQSGGLFYQYRPCRRDANTIYDIENIRNKVVYARTPLEMNDPFDSMIGFSAEKIYDECIDILLNQTSLAFNEQTKLFIKILIKHKMLGSLTKLIETINELKKYILHKCKSAHIPETSFSSHIYHNLKNLYKNCPNKIKMHLDENAFLVLSLIVLKLKDTIIDEKSIVDALSIETALNELYVQVNKIRDEVYLPLFKDFLSKMTVSCFSASGWNNQLMWSHYANSYSGICVEYDFSKVEDTIGFLAPVEYLTARPTITLKDMGIVSFEKDEQGKLMMGEVDISVIMSYLLVKNKCWSYENEWRIINYGNDPYSPLFVNTPFIKSITIGLNLDPLCKHLLWDVCQENNIDCYQLVVNPTNYILERELLAASSFPFQEEEEIEYIKFLLENLGSFGQKTDESTALLSKSIEEGTLSAKSIITILKCCLDFLNDAYFLKVTFNRYCKYKEITEYEVKSDDNVSNLISQVNKNIMQIKMATESLDDNLRVLLLLKRLSQNDFIAIKKLTEEIIKLSMKHSSTNWHGVEATFILEKMQIIESSTED